jgi:hypothetical protein
VENPPRKLSTQTIVSNGKVVLLKKKCKLKIYRVKEKEYGKGVFVK